MIAYGDGWMNVLSLNQQKMSHQISKERNNRIQNSFCNGLQQYVQYYTCQLLHWGDRDMIDQWIEQLKKGECISERDLKKLCIHVSWCCALWNIYIHMYSKLFCL